jgi:hypothetical protein
MEVELEKLVKEKEQTSPMIVIPLNEVPLTGISTTTTCHNNITPINYSSESFRCIRKNGKVNRGHDLARTGNQKIAG